jgi:cellulose synthase/poly-beta-1,6-N-acetylglucosamine synthase-like glycosyltransferase
VVIALVIVAAVLFLLSLPVMIELTTFLVVNLLLRPARGGAEPAAAARPLRLVALIPAHNEERNIARCVSSVLSCDAGGHSREAIVVADNCSDGTAALARAAGARVIERFDDKLRGKGAALDYAIAALLPEGHDAYIIIDADTIVSDGFLKVMGDRFAGGAEALQCVNLPRNPEESPRIRLMNLALLSMNCLRPMGRELLGLSVGILGNGFGLSRKLLERVPYKANSITEDLEYHLRLIETGHKVRFVAGARVVSDFPVSKEGTETQRDRWEGGRFMLQRKLFLPMLGKILSGKAALIEPFFELMSLPLSYEVLILLALAIVPFQPFQAYGIASLCVILAQIVAAVALYGTARDLRAFLEVPGYVFWKLIRLPSILRTSRRDSAWVRTKRD